MFSIVMIIPKSILAKGMCEWVDLEFTDTRMRNLSENTIITHVIPSTIRLETVRRVNPRGGFFWARWGKVCRFFLGTGGFPPRALQKKYFLLGTVQLLARISISYCWDGQGIEAIRILVIYAWFLTIKPQNFGPFQRHPNLSAYDHARPW